MFGLGQSPHHLANLHWLNPSPGSDAARSTFFHETTTPTKKRVRDMTCEEMRSECKKLKRKVSGDKADLAARLLSVSQENDKGWTRKMKSTAHPESYLASGEFRDVWVGTYTQGPRKGERSVSKKFKTGAVFEARFFADDIKAVDKAAEIIEAFNRDNQDRGGKVAEMIYLTKPKVWTERGTGQKVLVEPYVQGFKKFNSNSGWVDNSHPVMQALSHFSYHNSNGETVLCDLQGGRMAGGNYMLTDPVVLSLSKQYGGTDGGSKAISTFFSTHVCNQYCKKEWRKPQVAIPFYPVRAGTSFFFG